MGTIFQREEKPESLFDKIVKNEGACERLQELFYEKIEESGEPDDEFHNRDAVCFTKALLGRISKSRFICFSYGSLSQ